MESKLNLFQGSKLTKNEIKRRLNKMHVLFNPELTQKSYFAEKYDNAIKDPEKRKWIEEDILKDNNQAQAFIMKRVRDESPVQNEDMKQPLGLNEDSIQASQAKKLSSFSVVRVPVKIRPDNRPQPIRSISPHIIKKSENNIVPIQQDKVEERRNVISVNNKRRTICNTRELQPSDNGKNDSVGLIDRSIRDRNVNNRHSVDSRRNRNEVYQACTSVDNVRNNMNYHPLRRVNNIAGPNDINQGQVNVSQSEQSSREEDPKYYSTYQRYNIGNNSTRICPNDQNQSKPNMGNRGTNYSNIRRVDEPKQVVPNIVISREVDNYYDDFIDVPSKDNIQQDTSISLSPIKADDQFHYQQPQRPPTQKTQTNPFKPYSPTKKNVFQSDTNPSSGSFFPRKDSSIYLPPSSYAPEIPYALLFAGLSLCGAGLGYYYCLKNDISIKRYITSHLKELSLPEPINAIKEIKFDDFISTVLSPFKELTNMILHPKRLLYNIIWKGLKYITRKLFWEYVMYTLPLVLLKAFLFFLYRRYKENEVAKEIFHSIKGILEDKLSGVNLNESDFSNDFEDGLTEREIITKYSELYHYTEKDFVKKIMPKLQMLRRKDPYMKIYETMIKGKRQIIWQILH